MKRKKEGEEGPGKKGASKRMDDQNRGRGKGKEMGDRGNEVE